MIAYQRTSVAASRMFSRHEPKHSSSLPSRWLRRFSRKIEESEDVSDTDTESVVSPRTAKRRWPLKNLFFSSTVNDLLRRNRSNTPRVIVKQASVTDNEDGEESSRGAEISDSTSIQWTSELSQISQEDGGEPVEGSMETKSTSMVRRFPLGRLRAKQETHSVSTTSRWKPQDGLSWRNVDGDEITLRGNRLELLSDMERMCLQKIAQQRLQKMLATPVTRPRSSLPLRHRRQKYMKRKAQTVNILERKEQGGQQVFGIPLSECIENEQRQKSGDRSNSLDFQEKPIRWFHGPKLSCDSSRSDVSGHSSNDSASCGKVSLCYRDMDLLTSDVSSPIMKDKCPSNDSLTIPAGSTVQSSPVRRCKSPAPTSSPRRPSGFTIADAVFRPHSPQVPRIVETCTDFLKKRGLLLVGLFRVAGSAKRCRHMRLLFDTGHDMRLDETEDPQPHDIATLLKEYLRDLPDPLLSADLYSAFINVAKLAEEERVEALRYLVALLPTPNIDTLLVLLKFLQDVVEHSYDTIGDDGVLVLGNKMNAHNLATIFAPSILRSGSKPRHSLAESDSVITIVEVMISNVDEIFHVPASVQQEYCKILCDTEPEALDEVLNRLHVQSWHEKFLEELPAEMQTTIYYSTQEETFPQEIRSEADGSVLIKTKQTSTHRIVYKVHKPSDTVLAGSQNSATPLPERSSEIIEEKFPELNLFIDDDYGLDEPIPLINPNLRPSRACPLVKLSNIWPSKSETAASNKEPG